MARERHKRKRGVADSTNAPARGGVTDMSVEGRCNGTGAKRSRHPVMRTGQLQEQEDLVGMTKSYEIPKKLVWDAFQRVKATGGVAGVDQESLQAFEAKLKTNLYKIWNRMSSGSYFPPPLRGVNIPKKSGGMRTLGVPTVADRVAQSVVKMVREPILEPVFQ
jgi:hypothetical protein